MNAIVNPSFNTRDRCCLVSSLAAAITCLSLYRHILFITSPLNFTWPMCWSSFASFGPWWSCNTSWPLCVPGSVVNIMPSLGCVVDMVGANNGNYVHRLCGKIRHFVKMQIFWKKHFLCLLLSPKLLALSIKLLLHDHETILILIQKASEGKWGTELWTITDMSLEFLIQF